MRGSAYTMLEVWIVNQRNRRSRPNSEVMYGHSAVSDMNNNIQREDAFRRSINQAVKQYRKKHHLTSDDEVNYNLLSSGIIHIDSGERKYYKNRITPVRKREIHKEIYLGKNKPITMKEMQKEISEEEYTGKKKDNFETTNYIIDTGNIKTKNRNKLVKN